MQFQILINIDRINPIVYVICIFSPPYVKTNLSFLIEPFFNITKNSGQKCKYLKNENNFKMEYKPFSSF